MAWRAVCCKHDKKTKWEYYGHNLYMFCSQLYKKNLRSNVRCMLIIYSRHKTNILVSCIQDKNMEAISNQNASHLQLI